MKRWKQSLLTMILTAYSAIHAATAGADEADVSRHLRQGMDFVKAGKLDEAFGEFDRAVQVDPKHVDAQYFRGWILVLQRKYDQAIPELTKAIELDAKCDSAYLFRGICRQMKDENEAAVRDFNRYLELTPAERHDMALRHRGDAHHSLGKLVSALADLDRSISINPQFADTYGSRAAVRRKLGMSIGAIEDYSKVLSSATNRADIMSDLGRLYIQVGDYEHAISLLSRASKYDANDLETRKRRWIALSLADKPELAEREWHELVSRDPKMEEQLKRHRDGYIAIMRRSAEKLSSADYISRGQELFAAGYAPEATSDFRRAVELDPRNADAYYRLGNALKDRNSAEAALDTFKRCTEQDERHAAALGAIGEVFRSQLKQPEEAIRWFDRALSVEPHNALALASRGAAKLTRNDLSGAAADLDKAITLNDGDAASRIHRGELRIKRGDLEGAIVDAEKALEQDPRSAAALLVRGNAKRLKGQLAAAVLDLNAAIMQSRSAQSLMYRGLAFHALGMEAESERDFSEARKLNASIDNELKSEVARIKKSGIELLKQEK